MGTTALESLRQSIIKKLYAGHYPIVSNTTSDSDSQTILDDIELAPAAQIEDFFQCYIFVSEQPTKVDSETNVNESGTFTATDTTLTVQDNTKFTAGDGIQIDDEILRVTTVGSSHALTVVRGIQGTDAAAHDDNSDVYIIGPAVGEIARVTNTNFSGSTSQFTLAPALSASLVSGTEYEIHYHFYPNQIRDKANEILGNVRHPIFLPLSLITNGDFENSSGADTDWTAGGTATLANETTTVLFGRQSLKITASAADDYAESAAVYLPPNTNVLCAAYCYITSGDSAKLILYDSINGADIETAESDITGWVLFMFTAAVPSDCEAVTMRLESQGSGDVTYWNAAVLLPTQRNVYDYPSSLDWSEDFEGVFYFPTGDGLSGSNDDNAYRILEQATQKWGEAKVLRDETAVVPFRIQLGSGSITVPLFVRGSVDYGELTDDTDTTYAPNDIIIDLTLADMLDAWSLELLNQEKVELAQAKSAKAAAVRNQLAPRMRHFHKDKGKVRGAMR